MENATRASLLMRALRAGVERDLHSIGQLCTPDVKVWAPQLSASSVSELTAELERRDTAFSDIAVEFAPLDVGGQYACVEWTVIMTHSGKLALSGDLVLDPTGARVTLHGATVAEFQDDRICSLRQYWDEFAVLEQLGLLSRDS
jgi:ketosteroid isomerase-like protein